MKKKILIITLLLAGYTGTAQAMQSTQSVPLTTPSKAIEQLLVHMNTVHQQITFLNRRINQTNERVNNIHQSDIPNLQKRIQNIHQNDLNTAHKRMDKAFDAISKTNDRMSKHKQEENEKDFRQIK